MEQELDAAVVGAGQAGLAVSYLLSEAGKSHVVFERGRIAESWRSQRWDSFALNTPNWANLLPGIEHVEGDPDAFALRDELVASFEGYASSFSAPVEEQTPVTALERIDDGNFRIETPHGTTVARSVVVCSGSMSAPNMPAMAERLPSGIANLSAATYRNARDLPDGGVVVVGSGQSGCQIVEDLLGAGRQVYLCASKVGRIPRRYRGRDILEWWADMGFLDVGVAELEDPALRFAAQPQVSGTGGGHTISLQSLARDGAVLLGRVEDIDGKVLRLAPTVRDCIAFADERCEAFKAAVDAYIAHRAIEAPPREPDPYEPPLPDLEGSDELQQLDLDAAGVSTIIWCVGFHGDFSWIRHDITDDRGMPLHDRGLTSIPGLYFVGFPWLSKRKSGILYGVGEDARHVVDDIVSNR